MHRGERRPAPLNATEQTLIGLEAALAITATAGAIGLISGSMDLGEVNEKLPSHSPVLAGFALATVNGALPTVVVVGALRRARWADEGHVAVGAALVAWIAVQVGVIGPTSSLQPLLASYGLAITALGLRNRRERRTERPS